MLASETLLVLSVVFYVAVLAAAVAYALLVKRSHLLDPVFQFLALMSLFVLPLPIRASMTTVVEGDVTEHLPLIFPYLPVAVVLSAVGVPLFMWCYYSRFSAKVGAHLPVPPAPTANERPYVAAALIIGFSTFLLIRLASDTGSLVDFVLLGYGSTSESFQKGYLAAGFPWLFVGSLFFLYRYAASRKRLDLLLFIIALLPQVGMNVILGDRHSLMYMGIVIVLFWHMSIRRLQMKTLVATGVICFVTLNVVGYLRGSKYENIADFWTRTTTAYADTSGDKQTFYYTLIEGEFVVPFETFPQMIRTVGFRTSPQLGMSYIRAPLFFIPKAIFPARPQYLMNWYMREFYGGGWDLSEGRQFFFLSEGYLNFGVLGVLLTMMAWGCFLGALQAYAAASKRSPGAAMLYAVTLAFLFRAIAGDFTTMLVGLPEQDLLIAICGLVVSCGWKWSSLYRLDNTCSRGTYRSPCLLPE